MERRKLISAFVTVGEMDGRGRGGGRMYKNGWKETNGGQRTGRVEAGRTTTVKGREEANKTRNTI